MTRIFGIEVTAFMPIVFVVAFLMTSLSIVDRVLAVLNKKDTIGDSLEDKDGHKLFDLFFERFDCLKDEVVRHLSPAHYLEEDDKQTSEDVPPESIASDELNKIQLALHRC